MTTLTAVNARITGDSSGLQTALDRAENRLRAFGRQTREVINRVAKFGAAAAAAGTAVGVALVKRSLDAIDAQAKLARSLNTTTASIATLQKAGVLAGVSMSGIEQATKDLTRRLSQAASGTGPAVDALNRLGLSAQQLSMMPLDKRVSAINSAISEFIPAAEQAAVAGQLFGEEGSIAMSRIDPATIASAAREVEALGTAVSDVDAAAIERANDAMSSIGEVVRGVGNRIAVQLAPLIEAVANNFRDSAIEARGFENEVGTGIESLVNGMSFLLDAVAGVSRTFEILGKSGAVAMLSIKSGALGLADSIVFGPAQAVKELIEQFNSIPIFPDIPVPELRLSQQVQDEIALTNSAIEGGVAEIQALLLKPLPGNALRDAFTQAQAASEELRARMAGLRDELQLIELPGVMMKEGGQTEEEAEAHRQQIADRLERVRQGLLSEAEIELEAQEAKQEALRMALENELITEEQHREMLRALEEQHSNKMANIRERGMSELDKITRKSMADQAGFVAQGFADMTAAAASGNKAMFELNKVAAIASGLLDLKEAVTGAYKVGARIGGPPLGAAYAAVAGATQLAQLNSIRSQSFGGGGGAAPSVSQTPAPAVTPVGGNQGGGDESRGSNRTVSVAGVNPDELFSGRQLIELINNATEDGARLILVD